MNRKVGVLTKQVSELSVGPQGVQRRLSTLRRGPGEEADGCVGYLKKLLLGGGSGVGAGSGGAHVARSPRERRMAVGSSSRSHESGARGSKRRPKRGGYGELDSEGYV